MNPGVSTTATSGRPNELQNRHEPGRLLGAVGVEHAAQVARLVGHDRHRQAVDARERGHHVARPPGPQLQQRVAVDDRLERFADVVGAARRRRDERSRVRVLGIDRGDPWQRLTGGGGQIRQQLAHARGGAGLVALDQMADAVAVVDVRAAESGSVDLLAQRLADDAGAGQEHGRVLGHHDQVGERRRVGAAPGRGAGHDRDLRHHAGQRHRAGGRCARSRPAPRCPPACGRRLTPRTPPPGSAPGRPSPARGRWCRRGARPATRRRTMPSWA